MIISKTRTDAPVVLFSGLFDAVMLPIVGQLWSQPNQTRPADRIIANVSCSTLFIHGEADSLIPAEHSLKLFKQLARWENGAVTP